MDDKKDILEFPLEDVSIPQAIGLMMQAATKTVVAEAVGNDLVSYDVDMERLTLLCEKLEARVEDELTKGARSEAVPEDNPNEPLFSDIEGHTVSLKHEFNENANGDVVTQVVVDNMVYVLTCNKRVYTNPETGETTTCIKKWEHESLICEDAWGNER